MKKEEVGHNFLARLGKTRLRPGGKVATDWLIANGDFNKEKKVLEVACNMGTTAIQLAKEYSCHITGIDLDEEALEKARANIKENNVEELVQVQRANATKLPLIYLQKIGSKVYPEIRNVKLPVMDLMKSEK